MILHIKAIGAIDIPKMDLFGKADPYLKITDSKSKKTYQTHYCKQTYSPIWNEEFHIPVENDPEEFIHISLIDWDPFPRHDLVSTRDFPISNFKLGVVTDNFYDFYPAENVKKPGKVHLVFHLSLPDQKPFVNTKQSLSQLPTTTFSEETLRNAFNEIDQDHNGSIDFTETQDFLEKVGINSIFARLAFEICGKSIDSPIKFEEFEPFYKALNDLQQDKMSIYRYLFNKFDTDKNGFLDTKEVVHFLSFFGCDDWDQWDEDDAIRFIDNHDSNHDGKLCFRELCDLIDDELPK